MTGKDIRLIVTDIDRTLLRDDKTISDYTRSVLAQCRAKGIATALATGRPRQAMGKILEQFTPDYIIADNGGHVYHGAELLYRARFPEELKRRMIQAFLASPAVHCVCMECPDCLLSNHPQAELFEEWHFVFCDFNPIPPDPTAKLTIECADWQAARDLMVPFLECTLYSNTGEDWHQITLNDCTKPAGIRIVAEKLGLGMEHVVAFGDDYNDIAMLTEVETGVAVANAIDEVKAAADEICPSNNEDGVAHWLEENLL